MTSYDLDDLKCCTCRVNKIRSDPYSGSRFFREDIPVINMIFTIWNVLHIRSDPYPGSRSFRAGYIRDLYDLHDLHTIFPEWHLCATALAHREDKHVIYRICQDLQDIFWVDMCDAAVAHIHILGVYHNGKVRSRWIKDRDLDRDLRSWCRVWSRSRLWARALIHPMSLYLD